MKRVLLLTGLVVAVVVPTALIVSAPAQAKPQFYSAQQVLRVFKARGIALHRAPDDDANTGRETFTGLGTAQLSIDVLGRAAALQEAFVSACQGGVFPAFLSRGNVGISWCGASKAEIRRINAAADHLRYSPGDASHPLLRTFVLRNGASRVVDLATVTTGAAVDCLNGAATASQPLYRRMRTSQTEVAVPSDVAGSSKTDYATLAWRRLSGSRFRFSCR